MKFVCDKCEAHYLISDDKVGTRGVKVKCKKCGNVIVVRPENAADGAAKAGRSKSSAEVPAAVAAPPDDAADEDATSISNAADLARAVEESLAAGKPIPGSREFEDDKPTVAQPRAALSAAAQGDAEVPTQVNQGAEVKEALQRHREAAAAPAPAPIPEPAPVPEAAPAAAAEEAAPAGTGGDLENELAGAFDGLFGGLPSPDIKKSAPPPAAARSYATEQVEPSRPEPSFGGAAAGLSAAPAAPAQVPSVEWYAAIKDEQRGPFNLGDLETHWLKQDLNADSLVWRTGMADWIPLRDVKDLKYLLDLVPQKKPAPAPSMPAPTLSGMMPAVGATTGSMGLLGGGGDDLSEEAWRPRGMTSVYRAASTAEASVGASGGMADMPPPAEDPKWAPSAASSLAALVDDEINSMKKKKPAPAAAINTKPPPASDDSIEAPLPSLMGASGLSLPPLALPPPAAAAPEPEPAPVAPVRGGAAPLPYSPPKEGMSTGVKVGLGVGGGLVLLIAAVAGGALLAPKVAPPPPAPVAAAQPAQPAPVAAQPQPGTGQPAGEQPAAAQPAAAQPAAAQPVAAQPAAQPAEAAQPAAAQPAPAKAQDPPADTRQARAETRKETRGSKPQAREERPAKVKEEAEPRGSRFAAAAEEPAPRKAEPAPAPKAAKKSDCDPILYPEGCEDKPKKAAAPAGAKETLSKSDILTVVKNNKADISACVAAQRKKDDSLAQGVVKVSWVIKNSGKTASVSVEDGDEYASAYIGKCLVRAVQGWSFPAYSGDELKPIKFPFKLDQF